MGNRSQFNVALKRITIELTEPGVDVDERSERATLFRLMVTRMPIYLGLSGSSCLAQSEGQKKNVCGDFQMDLE
jgi:hypothetical protein